MCTHGSAVDNKTAKQKPFTCILVPVISVCLQRELISDLSGFLSASNAEESGTITYANSCRPTQGVQLSTYTVCIQPMYMCSGWGKELDLAYVPHCVILAASHHPLKCAYSTINNLLLNHKQDLNNLCSLNLEFNNFILSFLFDFT